MGFGLPVAQTFWLLTSDLDGQSPEAARKARDMVERAVDQVRDSCGSAPRAMKSLRERVRVTTAKPLGQGGAKALEDAFATWTEAIGADASPVQGWTADLRRCERLGQQVRAGYALWWDYSSTGRRWWVELQVDNETARGRYLELSGTMWVTGLLDPRPDRFTRRDKKRGGREVAWGGSSADSMSARPFATTSKRVGLGRIGFVYTTAQGTVYGLRPEVFAPGGGRSCSLPVQRLN
jgi:hypothetical protein